jgi:fucose permease
MQAPNFFLSRPGPRPTLVRSAMGGFFLLGGLMALLGAALPVWLNYFHFDLATAGNYFLAFNLGIFASAAVSRQLLGKLGLRGVLVMACGLTAASLPVVAGIYSPLWMIAPLLVLGFATGMLTTGTSWLIFDTMMAPVASTMLSLAGVFFGWGAVSFTLLLWLRAQPSSLQAAAVLPALLAALYWRQRILEEPALQAMPLRLAAGTTRSPAAVLLAVALFFQSGSEWAAGGWMAVYWVRKLGVNREAALFGLALYWTSLTLGKVLGRRAPWLTTPFRQLSAGAGVALFGCLVLLSATGKGGLGVGSICLGAGLGALYPLIIGMIGERFRYYHPGFFNGLLSLSLIGGMLAPWSVGLLAHLWVIEWAVWVPAAGIGMVYVLLVVLLVEGRLSRIADPA